MRWEVKFYFKRYFTVASLFIIIKSRKVHLCGLPLTLNLSTPAPLTSGTQLLSRFMESKKIAGFISGEDAVSPDKLRRIQSERK